MAVLCTLSCLLFIIFCSSISIINASSRRDKCPLSCECTRPSPDSTEWQIKCGTKEYWNAIPPLPRNTSYLRMQDCNITVLLSNSFTPTGGKILEMLTLSDNSMSSIEVDAFRNLGRLKFLTLSNNHLKELRNNTFLWAPNITELNLDVNEFRSIPTSNICLLKKLNKLNLSRNNITSLKFHECFGELKDIYSIDLSENPIKKLKPDDFSPLKDVKISEIFLTRLGLTSLPSGLFQHLRYLKILSFQENKFLQLSLGSLTEQFHLETLILKTNKLRNIPGKTVAKMPYLKELNLDENDITDCTFGEEFKNITNLRRIDLGRNPLKTLRNTSFLNLGNKPSLLDLILTECNIEEIEADTFLPVKSLEYLKLQSNALDGKMLSQAFYGLRFAKNLSELYLSGLPVDKINSETFKHLTNTSLKTLDFAGSRLKVIPAGAFQYLRRLETLLLGGSQIQSISDQAFEHLEHLDVLDLSSNQLLTVPVVTSVQMPSLRVLDVARNAIGSIDEGTLKGYAALHSLLFDGNNIRNIAPKAFVHTPKLETLTLDSNKITSIQNNTFMGLENLQILTIIDNELNAFESTGVFSHFHSLQKLDLSDNIHLSTSIKRDFRYLFRPLTNLTSLYLVSTGLENIPDDTFHGLSKLTILSLTSNKISRWTPELLQDQSKVELLSFTNNKITTVHKEAVEQLTSLKELVMPNNMFICDCELQWFTTWIRSGTFVYINDLDSLVCTAPAEKRGQKLVDLRLESECMSMTFYYVYLALLVAHVLVVTITTVVYRLRYYIKYWRHLVRAQKAMKEHMGEERFVFDAFVSYTRQDQKWVIKELLEKVEKENKIKLCLHQRNWYIGGSIPGNILNSIKKSRKTVLVLSNAYARSYWCELEMAIAQQKVLTSQRDVVVPILLEPIRKRHVTEQMVCLFATQTYVKWPQRNEKKQRRFWRKLVKTLRPEEENPEYDDENKDFLTTIF